MATKTKKTTARKTPVVKPTNGSPVKKYDYVVEHGIQMSGVRTSNLQDKFPFEMMKPGDSFLIPAKDPLAKNPGTLHYAAKQYSKMKPGFLLASRMQLSGERRVWRIK